MASWVCVCVCLITCFLWLALLRSHGRSPSVPAKRQGGLFGSRPGGLTALRKGAEKRLLDTSGMVLEGSQGVKKSKLENGVTLTLQVRRPAQVSVVTLLGGLRHWKNAGDGSLQLSHAVEIHAGRD